MKTQFAFYVLNQLVLSISLGAQLLFSFSQRNIGLFKYQLKQTNRRTHFFI